MENRTGASGTNTYDIYDDMNRRTNGELYIGVVGPVRTGKSTFIKHFMDELVLPMITDENERVRTMDELPQSSGGKTITTTEPKFIPKQAVSVNVGGSMEMKVRLIDCVGYMVEGAVGHMEEDTERMVHTPWFDYEIPFTQAAEIGTEKVIRDHSNIGIVITTDGSFGEIPRESYREAEERTIRELKQIGKPFIVIVNTTKPYGEEAKQTAASLSEAYGVRALPMNVEQMKKSDIHSLMEQILLEFPIKVLHFYMPKWVEMLSDDHEMKAGIIEYIRKLAMPIGNMRQLRETMDGEREGCEYIKKLKNDGVDLSRGSASYEIGVDDAYYYKMLSEIMQESVSGEYELLSKLKEMAARKREYDKYAEAVRAVKQCGYGVVLPEKEEISLDAPEVIRHGNKFGVKMKAMSPSVHLIRANIETEIAPIVGTEEQAKDLMQFMKTEADNEGGIWDTNIFGKTVEQLVEDGIQSKISMLGEESQVKLQDTMQQIVNDSNGKMVCIII